MGEKLEADWVAPDGGWLSEPRPCLGREDLFFANRKEVSKIGEAMELCASCVFRPECEELREVSGSQFGIWAGKYYPQEEVNGA